MNTYIYIYIYKYIIYIYVYDRICWRHGAGDTDGVSSVMALEGARVGRPIVDTVNAHIVLNCFQSCYVYVCVLYYVSTKTLP